MGIIGHSIRFMESWAIDRKSATSAASLFRLECDANSTKRHVRGFTVSIGPAMRITSALQCRGKLIASPVGLSVTHIRIDDRSSSKYDIWQYVGLTRPLGVCDQISRLFGMPSRDRVS